MLIFDDVFAWEGWGGPLRLGSGKCRLRIADLSESKSVGVAMLKPIAVLVTDIAASPMSVKSCIGHIATRVTASFGLNPVRTRFIEYYPRIRYGKPRRLEIPERFEVVTFSWDGNRAMQPRWQPVPPPLLDQLRPMVVGWQEDDADD